MQLQLQNYFTDYYQVNWLETITPLCYFFYNNRIKLLSTVVQKHTTPSLENTRNIAPTRSNNTMNMEIILLRCFGICAIICNDTTMGFDFSYDIEKAKPPKKHGRKNTNTLVNVRIDQTGTFCFSLVLIDRNLLSKGNFSSFFPILFKQKTNFFKVSTVTSLSQPNSLS